MEKLLTIQEVADYLHLSRTTVWRLCQSGELPAFKVGRTLKSITPVKVLGNGWRVRKSDVDKMVTSK